MAYVIRRLFMSLFTLFIVATITFFLMHMIPGGPFTGAKALPASILHALNDKFGLDKPLPVQYFSYLGNALTGNLGVSIKQQGSPVTGIIAQAFPVSLRLGLVAAAFAMLIGVLLGAVSAQRKGRAADYIVTGVTAIGTSVPSFVVAATSIIFFGVSFRLLPTSGLDTWRGYILPGFALSLFPLSFVARLMRSSMLEVLGRGYIKAARAKGLSERSVIFRHALKNAILPVVTYLGPLMASILTGSFVIESIFSIPGLGRYFVESVADRDYPVIMGTTIFYAAFLIAMNFIVDMLYMLIDPRIKMKSREC